MRSINDQKWINDADGTFYPIKGLTDCTKIYTSIRDTPVRLWLSTTYLQIDIVRLIEEVNQQMKIEEISNWFLTIGRILHTILIETVQS